MRFAGFTPDLRGSNTKNCGYPRKNIAAVLNPCASLRQISSLQRLRHPVKRLHQRSWWQPKFSSTNPFPSSPNHAPSFRPTRACLRKNSAGACDAGLTAVEPGQIGALHRAHADAGQAVRHEIASDSRGCLPGSGDIRSATARHPIRGQRGSERHEIDTRHDPFRYGLEAPAQSRVGDDRSRTVEAGDVEGLARRDERDRAWPRVPVTATRSGCAGAPLKIRSQWISSEMMVRSCRRQHLGHRGQLRAARRPVRPGYAGCRG